jgi:hypothetical protein
MMTASRRGSAVAPLGEAATGPVITRGRMRKMATVDDKGGGGGAKVRIRYCTKDPDAEFVP